MKRIIAIFLSLALTTIQPVALEAQPTLDMLETWSQTNTPAYYIGYGFTLGYSHSSQTYTTTALANTNSNGILASQPIGNGYYTASTSAGFVAIGTTMNKAVFFSGKNIPISRTNRKLARITWYSANASVSDSTAPMAKVGSTWYKYGVGQVSTTARSSGSTAFDVPTFHDVTIDESAGWAPITMTAGSQISLGAEGALPAGDVLDWGMYISKPGTTSNNNAIRFDNLGIYTSPASGYTQLSAPASVSASGTTLSWPAVANAASYAVSYNSGLTYTNVGNVTSVTVAALNQNYFARYQIGVRAIGSGSYVQSETKWITTELLPADLVYQENFAYLSNTGDQSFTKWQAYADAATASNYQQSSSGDTVLGIAGFRSYYPVIHKSGWFGGGGTATTKVLSTATTQQLGISMTGKYISRVSWAQANVQQAGANNFTTRFMAKVGSQWYVLDTVTAGYLQAATSTSFSNASYTPDIAINEGEARWFALTIGNEGNSSGITYTLSTERIALPPGNLNGAGWFLTSPASITLTTRYDNLRVFAAQSGASSVNTGLPIHFLDN